MDGVCAIFEIKAEIKAKAIWGYLGGHDVIRFKIRRKWGKGEEVCNAMDFWLTG